MRNLPKENIYGHRKKVLFILACVNRQMQLHGKPIYVLDFGCGNGRAVSQFLIQDGVEYYGIDIHEPSLEYARSHFANKHAVFLNHVPEGVMFDVIVCADILEHLDAPASVLRLHHNHLRQNGIIIGAVPNGFGPFEMEKRLDNWFGLSSGLSLVQKMKSKLVLSQTKKERTIPYNSGCSHVQFFTRKSLFSILQRSGFQIECFRNGAFVGAPLSGRFLFRGGRFAKLNSRIADHLPHWAVSTWYFMARKC